MGENISTELRDQERYELLALYSATVDELRITKTQAWTFTNYLITLHVGGFLYVKEVFHGDLPNQCLFVAILILVSTAILVFALWLVITTAHRNARNRRLLIDIGDKMGGTFAELNRPKDNPRYLSPTYDYVVVVPLCIICAATWGMFITYLLNL